MMQFNYKDAAGLEKNQGHFHFLPIIGCQISVIGQLFASSFKSILPIIVADV
jgi:hypothetical protein